MIFQEPMTSLNPVYTCGDQISEAVSLHEGIPSARPTDRAVEMLGQVGIPDAEAAGAASTRTSSRAACASAS